jgi:predicted nucleic acid-binding protein
LAGSTGYTVLLDACVLYPALLRSALIEMARADLFQVKWTERIHDEWVSSLLRNRNDLSKERLNKTRRLMNESVSDCIVSNFEHLEPALALPDHNDAHVLAAAIIAQADAIVTLNVKHFPASVLSIYNIEAIHPDRFLLNQITLDQVAALAAIKRQRVRLLKPPISAQQLIDIFEKIGLPQTAAELRKPSVLELI